MRKFSKQVMFDSIPIEKYSIKELWGVICLIQADVLVSVSIKLNQIKNNNESKPCMYQDSGCWSCKTKDCKLRKGE